MAIVYVEACPKGREEGSPIEDYAVEDHAVRVRHLNDKMTPAHWRAV